MLIIGIALAILVILTPVLVTSGGFSNRKLNEQLDLGAKYLSELDYEQAIVAFKAAIEIEPKCVEAYLRLADVYTAMEEYEMAVEVLKTGFTEKQDGKLEEKLIKLQMFSEQITELSMSEETKPNEAAKAEKKLNDIIIRDSRNINLTVDGGVFWGHKFSSFTIEQVREIAADKNWIATDAKVEKESWAYVLGEQGKSFYVFLWGDTPDKPLKGQVYQAGTGYQGMRDWVNQEDNTLELVKNKVEIGVAGIQFGDTLVEVLQKLGSEHAEEIVNLLTEWLKEYDWNDARVVSSDVHDEVYAVGRYIYPFRVVKENGYPDETRVELNLYDNDKEEHLTLFFFEEQYILYGLDIYSID